MAKSIDAKLAYLELDYGYDSTLGLVAKDAVVGPFHRSTDEAAETPVATEPLRYYNNSDNLMRNVLIPDGYARMSAIQGVELVEQRGNSLVLDVNAWIGDEVTTYRFETTLNQFVERDVERNHNRRVEPLLLDNGNAVLVVDHFSLTLHDRTVSYANISGILFTK